MNKYVASIYGVLRESKHYLWPLQELFHFILTIPHKVGTTVIHPYCIDELLAAQTCGQICLRSHSS